AHPAATPPAGRRAAPAAGAAVFPPADPGDLAHAAGVIIPGVGHFGATRAIDDSWRAAILDALDRGVPLLGICLGMQYLFEGSEEAPDVPGLAVLQGRCALLPSTVQVPHVGWDSLEIRRPAVLVGPAVGGRA